MQITLGILPVALSHGRHSFKTQIANNPSAEGGEGVKQGFRHGGGICGAQMAGTLSEKVPPWANTTAQHKWLKATATMLLEVLSFRNPT